MAKVKVICNITVEVDESKADEFIEYLINDCLSSDLITIKEKNITTEK